HGNDRICLVGRNGAGKSTLLKVIADISQADGGERFVQPGTQIAYLPQEPDFGGYDTVRAFVNEGLADQGPDAAYKADIYMEALGISGDLDPTTLSGGEARRAALARVIAPEPDILLLDEPTNHLDMPTIQWLEQELAGYRGAIVLISHDRRFLETLTRTTFWLDRGIVRRMDEGFGRFDAWSEEILTQEQTETKKLDKLIAQETVWSHQGITARRKRNMGRMRRLRDLRRDRAAQISTPGQVKLAAKSGESSGKLVVDVEDICKSYGDTVILDKFSTRILRGDKVGIIGPNGAGKTTLVRILLGDLPPDSGKIKLGTSLTPVFLDQTRSQLDPSKSVWDTLCDQGGDQVFVGGIGRHVISYLKDFLFAPSQAKSPVGSLSGGERNRLLLAKALAMPSNLLVLDEPTNDLDIDTLDILQEVLSDYDGTLLLVSHDRDFLDRIVTSTISLEGDGQVQEYPGGYSDYLTQRQEYITSAKPKAKADEKPKTTSAKKKKKLSYKQERALLMIPDQIDELDLEIEILSKKMENTNQFAGNANELINLSNSITKMIKIKESLEEEWLALELLKENLTES
ncbi:MAG: ABC-F family ATP-binding cassette domain-containing protein, partial [Rhodospirillales bacterium]|nr:ABC-F family ATP-binding cassette domain-containing protein [Rhodospirillales bacterium]